MDGKNETRGMGHFSRFTKEQFRVYMEAVLDRRAWHQGRATEPHLREPSKR